MTGTIETRLYDAIVGESSLSKITKLLEDDIDCNLSHFDLTTLNFVSPIQLAAKKATYRYGTLNLLYKKRNSPTKVQLEKHLTFFCNHYQLSNNEENELLFEFTVCRLLHNRISRYPVQEIHIIIAALFDYDEAKLRGQNLSIGSTHDMFLQVRIYALFQWIVDMKINASMTSESETFSTIESELLHNLEVYYLLHDILQIPVRITDDMNRQRFQQIESSQPLLMKFYRSIAENVINKIEQLRPQQEYTIPTGWRYHAVCVSFRRVDQTRISIRVDNPSRFNPPDMHEIDSSTASTHRIRPKVLGRLNVDNLNDSITTYIIMLIDSVKRDLTPDIAIPLIYDSKKIIKQLDRRQEENVLSFVEQAATNCFVKCFEPGLRIRFGKQQKLCEKLFLQEKNAANQLVNQCEMDSECRVNGSPDRFTRFVRLDDLNRLPLAPNATLQEKLKSSYKQHCRLLSNIMNEECSRPLIERFIDLRFKEENRIVQLRNLFSEPRVLVLGEAGSGKTTVCQYTAYSWACGKLWQSRFDWLFYIRMRNLNSKLYPLRSSNYSLVDVIVQECFRGYKLLDLEKCKLESIFACSSNILWILDGCDERTIPDHLLAIEQELLDKQNLLLTSRLYGTNKCHYDVKVHIQSFTNDDIKNYIYQYFSKFKHTAADKCWLFIKYSDQLKKAAHIPVYLQLICILWDSGKIDSNVGMTIGHLYEKICEYLLRRYLLKFHGLCTSALAGCDVFQHSSAKVFTYLECLAFVATQSHEFAITGHQISNVTGALFLPLLQLGLLKQKSRDHTPVLVERIYYFIHRSFQEYLCARYMRRVLTSVYSAEQDDVVKFITEEKYNRCMRDTFDYFFGLDRSSSCTDKFWSAVDCEPRDLIGLRHFSRIRAWFPYGSGSFTFDDKNKINKRTIDAIQEWILKEDRRPHDYGNTYIFDWFAYVIDKEVWLKAWKNDLLEKTSSNRRYFASDLWSEMNITVLRNIYDTIPENVQTLYLLIKNGPIERNLKSLQINTDLFPPPVFDKQIKIQKFIKEAQDKAKRRESITIPEEFRRILHDYSSYAKLNRQTTLCDEDTWPLLIAPSALINIDDETLELILRLSQQDTLFYRDFTLPIIPFLKLYGNSTGFNENTLCLLIVSIALSSSCIVTAPPGQITSIRVYENDTFVDIELGQNRRSALILEFDRIRHNYGYSASFLLN